MMENIFYGFGGLSRHMVWGGGVFMIIGGLILLGLFIYAIVILTRGKQTNQLVTSSIVHQDTGNALNILNERYARGEVSEEEYARKKSELRK